jgi:general secretion pathway protein L
MAQWLLIRLAREPERDPTWLVADEAGRVAMPMRSGPLREAAPLAAGRRVCALVPGTDVLVTEADVPVKSGAKLHQVVPYALEEQLAEDIEAVHFAVGKRQADGRVPVAVVSRALLDRWLSSLTSAGIRPDTLYADSELIPANPGQAVALLEGEDAILRMPGAAAVAIPVDAVAAAFDGSQEASAAEVDSPSRGLVLYAASDEWDRYARNVEVLRERVEGIKVQLIANGTLALFAQQLPTTSAINLLQAEYAPVTSFQASWRAWRIAAILAGCLLALHIAGKAVELATLQRAERRVDEAIEQTFLAAMPGERNTVDARRRMQQRLEATRGGGSAAGLLPALGALAQARSSVPGTTVQTLSYREGTLDLRMSAPNAESLDRLSQLLRDEGWQADLTSGSASEGGYEGRLQLRVAGAS